VTLAAAGVALLFSAASVIPASAATPTGVGTSKATTDFLDVDLGGGSLLHVGVVSDSGNANIDPTAGAAGASSALNPLVVSSKVLPINFTVPGLSSSSAGKNTTTSAPAINLGTALGVTQGTLTPPTLTSILNDTGAASGITAGLDKFGVVSGLLSIPSAALNLGANAAKTDSNGLRGITIPSVDVLNLGALLRGLGIDLTKLPLTTVTGLLDKLGVALPVGGQSLNSAGVLGLVTGANGLVGQITSLASQITSLGGNSLLSGVVGTNGILPLSGNGLGSLTGLLGGAGAPTSLVSSITGNSTLTDTLNALTGQLASLLDGLTNLLGNTSLLSVKDLTLGVTTKAADTVADSAAGVVAKLGNLAVGGINLGGIDIGQTVTQVTNVVNGVTSALSNVLGSIDPGLANLLSVKVFDQSKDVNQSNGYTHANAGLSALHVGIGGITSSLLNAINGLAGGANPSLLSILTGPTSSGGAAQAASSVPVVGAVMNALNTSSGMASASPLGALAQGASVDLVKVAAASDFATVASPATPVPAAQLPFTGENHWVPVFGLLFLLTGAGLVTVVRRTRAATQA
jgi:hypothetical protein